MGRFAKEVDDFIAAFRAGNEIGYKMRYLRYLEKQQQLNQQKFDLRQQRGTGGGGMPADTQDLINQNRDKRFGPGSENETPAKTPVTKQETVQPKTAAIPDATPTTKAAEPAPNGGATPQSSGGGSSGGDKHASITDRYPGSYQTAALETGTMNDASPVRSALGGVSSNGGATPRGQNSIGSWWTPDRMKYAANYLQDHAGLSKMGAAGLVARWAGVESAGQGPSSVNKNGGAFGIAQWLGNRKGPIAGNTNFDAQLAYAARELNSSEGAAAKVLRNASSPEEAARGASMYERAEHYSGKTGRDDFTDRTPVSKVYDSIYKGEAAPAATTPSTRETGSPPTQAINTRQRTAIDASSMSDASNDVRNVRNLTNASATTGGARYSSGGDSYAESIKNAKPATTPPSSAPSTSPQTTIPLEATGKMPNVELPKGLHYQQYGDGPNAKFLLIDDKTGAPAANLQGWEHASDAAKAVNNEPKSAVPVEPAKTETPEFPKTAGQELPTPPSRPDDLKPAVETQQQGDGWSFLDDIGQGFDQFGKDVESFFSDLNVPADWDVGSADAGWGTAADAGGGDMGGIGGALGGIGDAIGGIFSGFSRGGMVR